MNPPLIAMLTDFGLRDHYVGVMKAVMKGITPHANFIDITHAVPPQNVRAAAFILANNYRYFPAGTVFLVVVDPGVGTARRGLIAQIGDHLWIAPDNGILSHLPAFQSAQVYALENPDLRSSALSTTFHGRDVFAPAAAHAAQGVAPSAFGSRITDPLTLSKPRLTITPDLIEGEVVYVDHFGNIITSVGLLTWLDAHRLRLHSPQEDRFVELDTRHCLIRLAEHHKIAGVFRTYNDVDVGGIVPLVGSSGYLEISINQGNAAQQFEVNPGDSIRLRGEFDIQEGA